MKAICKLYYKSRNDYLILFLIRRGLSSDYIYREATTLNSRTPIEILLRLKEEHLGSLSYNAGRHPTFIKYQQQMMCK